MARHGPTEGGNGIPENENGRGDRERPIGLGGCNDDGKECCTNDNFPLDASGIVFNGGKKSAPTPKGSSQRRSPRIGILTSIPIADTTDFPETYQPTDTREGVSVHRWIHDNDDRNITKKNEISFSS